MILPTKRIDADRSLMAIGADILTLLGARSTVSGVWHDFQAVRRRRGNSTVVRYDWFLLALAFLYSLNLLELADGRLHRVEQ